MNNLDFLDRPNLLAKTIANILHETAINVPDGQSYNLHSKQACDILAEKVARRMINES
mgnify:FL=1|tara:strand:- start:170 stop:343 length:174 start_codon:yes stop_codon:yes gene_type:complete